MLDWVGKMIGLPNDFACFGEGSRGGGVIQGSASDCVLVCLLAARFSAIKALKKKYPFEEDGVLLSKLMAYCSKEVSISSYFPITSVLYFRTTLDRVTIITCD